MKKRSRRIVFISIAAAIVAAAVISTVFIIVGPDNEEEHEAVITMETPRVLNPGHAVRRDIVKSSTSAEDEIIIDNPVRTKEDLPIEAIETPDDISSPSAINQPDNLEHKAKGRQDAISTLEMKDEEWTGVFGIGGSGSPVNKKEGYGMRGGSPGRRAPRRTVSFGGGGSTVNQTQIPGTEQYEFINENTYLDPLDEPLSTFAIDVDTASYANVRRFITESRFPPAEAVRIEEMINYFSYSYPEPEGDVPFSISGEVSACPWNDAHRLVHIGIKGKTIQQKSAPPSNLVFLLDVSGSMGSENKLPLLKRSFKLLTNELRSVDKVGIVTYSSTAETVLSPTPGNHKNAIHEAVDSLSAGGSTAGAAGLKMAYDMAARNFNEEGNNRVILATDGDFNVGVSDDDELVRIIKEKRKQGIFLSILGFGSGNYKDAKMEKIADNGNGNYSYIDSIMEGKKVLVDELGGTLHTIAKDVKIQVEFNPAKVRAYRLIGYENRKLKKEDFNNDRKDAGELGAGHTVTALYELVPAGADSYPGGVDKLKYQENKPEPVRKPKLSDKAYKSDELMTVKLRYKQPEGTVSSKITGVILDKDRETGTDFRFSAAVAGFGMLLRNSEYSGDFTYSDVVRLAKSAKGEDENGYRAEFIRLAEMCSLIAQK